LQSVSHKERPKLTTTPMMKRYDVLVRVLDQLRLEAPLEYKSYHPGNDDGERLNTARSKAFIHLLLKVYFGLLEFSDREHFITEGSQDGGIDAYYVDSERKVIYFVQSKFRQTGRNFEEKFIEPEELLQMDITRILDGNLSSESGQPYNAKIRSMVDRIKSIGDIARYRYQVIILANAKGITKQKLTLLTGGLPTELFDHSACYNRLLFPLVSGSFFNAEELHLSLNLSNKNAGSKISYTAATAHGKCEITVVFVPTLEIAKAMYRYRNAILKHNPRSYLELEGQNVNKAIRSSIESMKTNEFALFNNGITMLSDETYLNERIGQKDRAQLTVVNPQIINGGQTAYTLSQIYKDHMNEFPDEVFGEKEVLVKIITFDKAVTTEAGKLALIESISRATNSQTIVTSADRRSNEPDIQAIQKRTFTQLGIFLERKRGEFADGMREGYLAPVDIVDRNSFLRAALVSQNRLREAAAKKVMTRTDFNTIVNVSDAIFQTYGVALVILEHIHGINTTSRYAQSRLSPLTISQTRVAFIRALQQNVISSSARERLTQVADEVKTQWQPFVAFCTERNKGNDEFWITKKSGFTNFSMNLYLESEVVAEDIRTFFMIA